MECGPRREGRILAVDLFLNVDLIGVVRGRALQCGTLANGNQALSPRAVVKEINKNKILRSHCCTHAASDEFGAAARARVYILSTRNYAEAVFCGVIRKRVLSDCVQS